MSELESRGELSVCIRFYSKKLECAAAAARESLMWSRRREVAASGKLCCLPAAHTEAVISAFWPRPSNRKSHPAHSERRLTQETRKRAEARTQPPPRPDLQLPVKSRCLKKGRNMWAVGELVGRGSSFTSFPWDSPSG